MDDSHYPTRAIPQGYMTVGEIAKKMNTTVRTLQYYDKEGILSPSGRSDGGRRLYTDKDLLMLYQIQSMKSLGFSLEDIKNRLVTLENPEDVVNILTEQAESMREKITDLSNALQAIEALKFEVQQMQTVDFVKYADIIKSLHVKNEFYWVIKHIDSESMDFLRKRFPSEKEAALAIKKFNQLLNKAVKYQKAGVSPESDKGQALAKEFWSSVVACTGGDFSLLSKLAEIVENANNENKSAKEKQELANSFIEPALMAYFTSTGQDPFENAVIEK